MYQVLVETPNPSFSSELVWLDTLPFHFWPECKKWNGRVWQCLRIWVYQVLVGGQQRTKATRK